MAGRSACGSHCELTVVTSGADRSEQDMGVHLVVPDLASTALDAAAAFYGDVLALVPVMDLGVCGASSSAPPMVM